MAKIHIGVGGWDFDPWRGTFYPAGLAKTKQLEHLGTRLTATEINATYYKLQSPETVRALGGGGARRLQVRGQGVALLHQPQDARRGGESIGKFCAQGFTELGDKLGPILWQLAPTKRFDPEEFARLPDAAADAGRTAWRCATRSSPRHESFRDRAFVAHGARGRRRDRHRRSRRLSRRSPTSPPISSMPGCSDARGGAGRLCASGARPLGGGGARLGAGESPPGLSYVSDARRRSRRANFRLLHQRRQSPQSGRRRGAGRAARMSAALRLPRRSANPERRMLSVSA